VQAARYCTECKALCCDSCVIEYHFTHIDSAKIRIEDYIKKQKNELDELKAAINTSVKHKTVLNELLISQDSHLNNIDLYFLKRKSNLEIIKSKIELLITDEIELCAKMKDNLQNFYKEECYRRLEAPMKNLEECIFSCF